jgi:hypothetical protein
MGATRIFTGVRAVKRRVGGYAYLGFPHPTACGQTKAHICISRIIIFSPVLELLQVLHNQIF